jgi:hypothetical protein
MGTKLEYNMEYPFFMHGLILFFICKRPSGQYPFVARSVNNVIEIK